MFLICVCAPLLAQAEKNNLCETKRIIALTPTLAEWASEVLGNEAAQKSFVGRVDFSTYPNWFQSLPMIGTYTQINAEKVLSLKPTCLLAQEKMNLSSQVKKLEDAEVSVVWIKSRGLFEMDQTIRELASVLGVKQRGEELTKLWNEKIMKLRKLAQKTSSPTVVIQVQFSPLVSVGGDTCVSELLELAGFQNVLKKTNGYPVISRETVISNNPDYLMIISMEKTAEGKTQELKRAREQWASFPHLKIAQPSRIQLLESDHFARCSFRSLFAAEELLGQRKEL